MILEAILLFGFIAACCAAENIALCALLFAISGFAGFLILRKAAFKK